MRKFGFLLWTSWGYKKHAGYDCLWNSHCDQFRLKINDVIDFVFWFFMCLLFILGSGTGQLPQLPMRPNLSYDDMRRKNRGEYSDAKQDPYR